MGALQPTTYEFSGLNLQTVGGSMCIGSQSCCSRQRFDESSQRSERSEQFSIFNFQLVSVPPSHQGPHVTAGSHGCRLVLILFRFLFRSLSGIGEKIHGQPVLSGMKLMVAATQGQ